MRCGRRFVRQNVGYRCGSLVARLRRGACKCGAKAFCGYFAVFLGNQIGALAAEFQLIFAVDANLVTHGCVENHFRGDAIILAKCIGPQRAGINLGGVVVARRNDDTRKHFVGLRQDGVALQCHQTKGDCSSACQIQDWPSHR